MPTKYISLLNNSSYNHSQIKEQTEKFSPILTPPLIINQEIIYTGKNFSIAFSARYQDESFINFENTSSVRAYYLLNSRASYQVKGFLFSVHLNNLTSAKYYNHAYVDFDGSTKYFVQAPMNFYSSIQFSF